MPNMGEYYKNLRQVIFSEGQLRSKGPSALGCPKVVIQLDRDFNDTAPFIAFDFIVELHQRYGKEIIPIELKDGCIGLTMSLADGLDFQNVDFRYLMLASPIYHDIFRRYGVNKIYLHDFPADQDSNIGHNKFIVDEMGKPVPAE